MAGKPKKHLVDGEQVTVNEVAERLGVKAQQLYHQMSHRKISLQVVVNLYRENQILHDQGRAARYMVDGRWLTVHQAAKALGVTYRALYLYMYKHQCRLAEAMAAYRHGLVTKSHGNRTVYHRVGRGTMTVAEAAAKLGVSASAVQQYMYKHKASLAATIRHYEQREKQRAEKEILGILGF
jgi:phage antirepressor YoqD-like protein